jgi:hypothetical protein
MWPENRKESDMLIHELHQEELLRERRAQIERLDAATRAGKRRDRTSPGFVRTLVPALTHGLLGIPAPPRSARGGC